MDSLVKLSAIINTSRHAIFHAVDPCTFYRTSYSHKFFGVYEQLGIRPFNWRTLFTISSLGIGPGGASRWYPRVYRERSHHRNYYCRITTYSKLDLSLPNHNNLLVTQPKGAATIPGMGQPDVYYPESWEGKWTVIQTYTDIVEKQPTSMYINLILTLP